MFVAASAIAASMVCVPVAANAAPTTHASYPRVTVVAGQTWTITQTTRLSGLILAAGGAIAAPDGYSVTMTVNGVETGQAITSTSGTTDAFVPGTYRGTIVLTVAQANPVTWQGLTFPFRQALFVDSTGVVDAKSVLSAVRGGTVTNDGVKHITISSKGEDFDGIYVSGGSYNVVSSKIRLTGNGRSDFTGYGAAVVADGDGTTMVLNHADISNQGAVRTGVVAENGSNVIVKNSKIHTADGTLPSDYQPTVDLALMESVPWMLSDSGNVRATNLLGVHTKASYINSNISSTGWGALSTDSGQDGQLTAIDSRVTTGTHGYGSYAIGNATERFLGTQFKVGDYAVINRGGSVYYGDSTRAAVAQLNSTLSLGLTKRELAALPVQHTTISSARFGAMWHGAGTVDVSGGTVVKTKETTFLDKGQAVGITVDGSKGARLNPGNGVVLQIMEDDDPGPQMVDGKLLNTGIYHEPTTAPAKVDSFDVTAVHSDDAVSTFSNITLKGNFYNGTRGGGTGGTGPGAVAAGRNLVLNLDNTQVTGVISASTTKHNLDTITAADYEQLGEVNNTPGAAINNGVIVALNAGSRWNATGTSYLTKLSVATDAAVKAGKGHHVSMTVNGVATKIVPGTTYTGAIVVSVK